MRDLKWTNPALLDFDELQNYIKEHNPSAARHMAVRVHEAVEALRLHPFSGRIVPESSSRICVVSGTPYLIVYRITAAVEVLRLWHSRRDWITMRFD
jgi:toxin ParE1/3/4